MRVEWHGQSAFTVRGDDGKVFTDPFGDMTPMTAGRDLRFEYPPIKVDDVDVLLVTHEHRDHNAVEAIGGDPATLRATAGTRESADRRGGSASPTSTTSRPGPSAIFVFEVDGIRVARFGDFDQAALRPERRQATGDVDLVLVPVGGGFTIGAQEAARIVEELPPRWVVPMHYRTPRIGFLETEEEFLGLMPRVERLDEPHFDTADRPDDEGPITVVPAAP